MNTQRDFTGHTSECDGSDSCPEGWLVIYSDRSGLVQPYDRAYRCQVCNFVAGQSSMRARKFWQYDYPDIRACCVEPRQLALRREITQMTSI